MSRHTIVIEPTTRDNAPAGWADNLDALHQYPIYVTMSGRPGGGGYMPSLEAAAQWIREITSRYRTVTFDRAFTPAYGAWQVSLSNRRPIRTYYSVCYLVPGSWNTVEAWFDSKDAADKFYASRNYRDAPVAHRTSDPAMIERYEDLCAYTRDGNNINAGR